jgi:hypothetical protein
MMSASNCVMSQILSTPCSPQNSSRIDLIVPVSGSATSSRIPFVPDARATSRTIWLPGSKSASAIRLAGIAVSR